MALAHNVSEGFQATSAGGFVAAATLFAGSSDHVEPGAGISFKDPPMLTQLQKLNRLPLYLQPSSYHHKQGKT